MSKQKHMNQDAMTEELSDFARSEWIQHITLDLTHHLRSDIESMPILCFPTSHSYHSSFKQSRGNNTSLGSLSLIYCYKCREFCEICMHTQQSANYTPSLNNPTLPHSPTMFSEAHVPHQCISSPKITLICELLDLEEDYEEVLVMQEED